MGFWWKMNVSIMFFRVFGIGDVGVVGVLRILRKVLFLCWE